MGIGSFIKKKLGLEKEKEPEGETSISPELEREFRIMKEFDNAKAKAQEEIIRKKALKQAHIDVERKIDMVLEKRGIIRPKKRIIIKPRVKGDVKNFFKDIVGDPKKPRRGSRKQARRQSHRSPAYDVIGMNFGQGRSKKKFKKRNPYDPIGMF